MERSIKVPGGCRLNHPLTRTYIIVPYSGSLQRLIVSKAQKPHSYITAGIRQIFRRKEAAMLPFHRCRELHPRTSDTRERRWKPPDGRCRRILGTRPANFISMEGGQDGR
jgi:hypothetical protein